MQNGRSFLQAHGPELTADDNMPAGFVKTFNVASDRFDDGLKKMNQASNAASEGRKTKVSANNNIYEKAMRMARDGARRAADDEEVRKLFVFSKVCDRIDSSVNHEENEHELEFNMNLN